MRVVLDTNVLISALLWPRGIPAQVVALARQGRVRSVTSPALLEELRRMIMSSRVQLKGLPGSSSRETVTC